MKTIQPMQSNHISDLFQIRKLFMRSVHIERDFLDQNALQGYILTSQTKTHVNQILKGLSPNSMQRAWRITGDYGTGKSLFALVLSHMICGSPEHLPKDLQKILKVLKDDEGKYNLLPVLVTGSREPLSICLLKAIKRALEDDKNVKRPRQYIKKINALIADSSVNTVEDSIVIQVINDTCSFVKLNSNRNGILIILDELGKFLEYAALHPDRQDVYLLQSLAETASRSKDSPLFIVGLLHQGFNAYADQLSHGARREWEKVAGRFEELLFNQPLEQTAMLIAEALNIKSNALPQKLHKQFEKEMSSTIDLGWYGSISLKKELVSNSARIYPLHPTVIPVLIKLFSRFGQNERSLFSFILSNEPFSLKAFSDQPVSNNSVYRLHNLYDYVRTSFGYRLSTQSNRNHWNLIDSIVESYSTENKTELHILKTIAILNLIDDNSLLPSAKAIELAVAGNNSRDKNSVGVGLDYLQKKKRVIYNRGTSGGFCLWPYTSVNLEKVYDEAKKEIGSLDSISKYLKTQLQSRPLVARRHYIETGNLRHFDVKYVSIDEFSSEINNVNKFSDGIILVPLCETEEDRNDVLELIKSNKYTANPQMLIAVPKPLNMLIGLVQEYRCWEWILQNVLELNNDRYAAEEVTRQMLNSKQILQKTVNSFIGLRQFSERMQLRWYYQKKQFDNYSGRELLLYISKTCDDIYNKAPRIKNELVNRREISPAAASGRIRLIERMFSNAKEPYLGMDPQKKPPEMSIYLSVLKDSGLHSHTGESYNITKPDMDNDKCNILPAIEYIEKLLEDNADTRICVRKVFDSLRETPLGIRDGVHSIFLAAVIIIHEHEVAMYEDSVFVQNINGDVFRRLIKAPDTFEIQLCRVSGVRKELFDKLFGVLDTKKPESRESEILDIVRPLCIFAANLPLFTHKTQRMQKKTVGVRDVLLNAKEPVRMIFHELPKACGYKAFQDNNDKFEGKIDNFVLVLRNAINELKVSYPELLEKIKKTILMNFDLPDSEQNIQDKLSNRANDIIVSLKEPRIKAFSLRLADNSLSEKEWLESIGSFVCSKIPAKWLDSDLDQFQEEMSRLAQRFRKLEALHFKKNGNKKGKSVYLSLIQDDGTEVEEVINIDLKAQPKSAELEERIIKLINNSKKAGLSAITRILKNELLDTGNNNSNDN